MNTRTPRAGADRDAVIAARSDTDMLDVLIVGGGLVGMSLACALEDQALRVGVLEARPWRPPATVVKEAVDADTRHVADFDARTVALSYGSRRIFETLGVWSAIEAGGVMPIRRIHVSDRGHLGVTHLDSVTQGVDALGYVAQNRVLGAALAETLRAMPAVGRQGSTEDSNVTFICPGEVDALTFEPDAVHVRYRQGNAEHTLRTRLLVAADGDDSTVRALIGARMRGVPYGQSAIIANVITERPHAQVAYERFTDTGPLALLPTCATAGAEGRTSALVWTVGDAQCEAIMALDEAHFLARLCARFGPRLGRFEQVSRRHAYPLSLLRVHAPREPRLVFIGNAAHILHPVAGQGFNLGLRDVAALAEVLVDAVSQGYDPGAVSTVQAYLRWRRRDQWQVSTFTDLLVRTFSTRLAPLALARNLGLVVLDTVPLAKRVLGRHAMGLAGPLPRLARGLPL